MEALAMYSLLPNRTKFIICKTAEKTNAVQKKGLINKIFKDGSNSNGTILESSSTLKNFPLFPSSS